MVPQSLAALAAMLVLGLPAVAAGGEWLPVPRDARAVIERVGELCRECIDAGFAPCGSAEIGFGSRFFPHFFRGEPATGYLVTHAITGQEFREALRRTRHDALELELRRRFAAVRLIAVTQRDYAVQLAGPPLSVRVTVPRKLHARASGTSKPLCCCCAGCAEAECCEKGLGSPVVELLWRDPLRPNRTLVYRPAPLGGTSLLYSTRPDGRRDDVRFCLDDAGPGRLTLAR